MNYKLIKAFIIIIISGLSYADNDSECDINPITDLKNGSISFDSVCGGEKTCLYKCCLENEVIYRHKKSRTCKHIDYVRKSMNDDLSNISTLADIKVYDSDLNKEVKVLKSHREFNFIHSNVFMNETCSPSGISTPLLLENGNAALYQKNKYKPWIMLKSGLFCVDVAVGRYKNKTKVVYFYKIFNQKDNGDATKKHVFIAIAMTISSVFLCAVLAAYGSLRPLRNLQGWLLMAYVATLAASYSLRAAQLFYIYYKNRRGEPPADTSLVAQIYYFCCLSSFFWLKIMSFDIWWTFRGLRKLREIHRRGARVKFLWYAAYACGVPAALAAAAAVVDARDLPPHIIKPNFATFGQGGLLFYLYIPIMVLTGINVLLFLMTVYNIWLIHRDLNNKATNKKSAKDQNRLWLYVKLSSLMGVGWVVEVAQLAVPPRRVPAWLFMVLNAYTMLTGVVIFFMFVFKRSIIRLLCQRFHIENRFTRALNLTTNTRSESSKKYSRTKSTTDSYLEAGSDLETKTPFKGLNVGPKPPYQDLNIGSEDEMVPLKGISKTSFELKDQNEIESRTLAELH